MFFYFFLVFQLSLFSKTLKELLEEAVFPVSIEHVEKKEQIFRFLANQGQDTMEHYGLEMFYHKIEAKFQASLLDFFSSDGAMSLEFFLEKTLFFMLKEHNRMTLEEKQNSSFLCFLDPILQVAFSTESFADFCKSLLFNISRKRVDLLQAYEVHLFFILSMILDGENNFLLDVELNIEGSKNHFESGLRFFEEKRHEFSDILFERLEVEYPILDELDVWGRHQIFIIFLNLIENMSQTSESPEKLVESLMNETKLILLDKEKASTIVCFREKQNFLRENLQERSLSFSRLLTVEEQLQLQFDREFLEQIFNSDNSCD